MRTFYRRPSEVHFDSLFSSRGGGIGDIRTYDPHSRGGSLFGVIGKLVRGAIPFLKNIFLPELPSFVNSMSEDLQSGVRFKDSLKRQGVRSGKNMVKRLITKARGGSKCGKKKTKGVSKKKPSSKKTRKKKKKVKRSKHDIFSKMGMI